MRSSTGILPVGLGGIGILPRLHGIKADATVKGFSYTFHDITEDHAQVVPTAHSEGVSAWKNLAKRVNILYNLDE